jgi:predicted nucleic acid-binding protein
LRDFETLPRRMSASAATKLLCGHRSAQEALKLARQELQMARRARSRKRFAFWTQVAAEMETLRAGLRPEGTGATGLPRAGKAAGVDFIA